MRLAERVIKRSVKIDDEPLTIDEIIDKVCSHFNVTITAVNSRSRKQDIVLARQVSMYLAQKHTKNASKSYRKTCWRARPQHSTSQLFSNREASTSR